MQGKSMLENKKLSDRERLYEFLRRIPIRRTYNSPRYRGTRFKYEMQATKAVDNDVMNVTTLALSTSQREMPMLGVDRWTAR